MPPLKQPGSLVQISLCQLAQLLHMTCFDKLTTQDKIKEAYVPYITSLPIKVQQLIYRTYLNFFPQDNNEKQFTAGLYVRADELSLTNMEILPFVLSKIDQKSLLENQVKYLYINCGINYSKEEEPTYRLYKPLYIIMKTFINLSKLSVVGVGTDHLLDIISQNCPLLEDLRLHCTPHITDTGVAHLCGFDSEVEAIEVLQLGRTPQRKHYCSILKCIYLNISTESPLSTAFLLKYCKRIESITVFPRIDMGEVFTLMYGVEDSQYLSVTDKYNLKVFQSSFIMEESHLALIMRICPHISVMKLRFSGGERQDKNLIANLLQSNVASLDISNCNVEALLWFIKNHGAKLSRLRLDIMLTALEAATLKRSHLHEIIRFCPNLTHIELSSCGSLSIVPDRPINDFTERRSWKHLESLIFHGASLRSEDLQILLWCASRIKKIHISCQVFDLSVDTFIEQFFSDGKMANLRIFYLSMPNPVLNIESLRKIICNCPYLHEIGPLSLWNMTPFEYSNFHNEIESNNWNLNIDNF